MRQFLEGRVQLVRELMGMEGGPVVDYADLVLILTAVLSACAALRFPRCRKDRCRFVELLIEASPPDARIGYISVPALLDAGLIQESDTPWGQPGEFTRIFTDEEIDCDLDTAVRRFPTIWRKKLKQYSYASLIYRWLRCGYAHEYCAAERVTHVPPSHGSARLSYIGRIIPSGIIVRMAHFHLDYLIELVSHHVRFLACGEIIEPKEWWLESER